MFCLGNKFEFTIDSGELHNVSLGQGQEAVAEIAMEKASKEGHWVILQVSQSSSLHQCCIAVLKTEAFQNNMCLDERVLNSDLKLPLSSPQGKHVTSSVYASITEYHIKYELQLSCV